MPSRIATPLTPAVVEPEGLLQTLERPLDLIKVTDETFNHLVEEFLSKGAPFLAAIKRGAGILAWAARHHLADSHYGAWLHRFADELGVNEDTVTRYRDTAINELGLPVAARHADRSRARIAGAVKAKAASPARQSPEALAAAVVLGPTVVGGSAAPARSLVEGLLELSVEDLADSASTEELRTIKALIEAALAEQQRIALRARLGSKDASRRRRVG